VHGRRRAPRRRVDEPRRLGGGFLAFLNLPDGAKGTATIESKTNFLGPVREGYVHGVTRALHTGKRTIVVDTELFDDAGKLVARVTQTQAVL